MASVVYCSTNDPAAGVIGQAFRVAGLRSRGETRAAVASCHHAWHESVRAGAVRAGAVSPDAALQTARGFADRYGIGALFQDSLGMVVGQAEAESAVVEDSVAPDNASYVRQASEALRAAASQGRDNFMYVLQQLQDHAPTTQAANAVERLGTRWIEMLEGGGRGAKEIIEHGMDTGHANVETMRKVVEHGLDTGHANIVTMQPALQEIGKAPKRVSDAAIVMAVVAGAIATMIFLRTGG